MNIHITLENLLNKVKDNEITVKDARIQIIDLFPIHTYQFHCRKKSSGTESGTIEANSKDIAKGILLDKYSEIIKLYKI